MLFSSRSVRNQNPRSFWILDTFFFWGGYVPYSVENAFLDPPMTSSRLGSCPPTPKSNPPPLTYLLHTQAFVNDMNPYVAAKRRTQVSESQAAVAGVSGMRRFIAAPVRRGTRCVASHQEPVYAYSV